MRWTLDGVTLDLDAGEIRRGTQRAPLSALEASLLRHLAERPGEVVANEELLRDVWGYHPRTRSRAVAKTLHRLRAKLEADPEHPRWLHTLRGQGLRFTPPSAPGEAAPPAALSLLGRAGEQAALAAWLEEGGPLLTLLGPGGIGKTRLAQWVAATAERRVVFCALDGVSDEARLLERLAAELSIMLPESTEQAAHAVSDWLACEPGQLLILDNLEESVEVAAPLIASWIAASDAQILVTSRRRLRLAREEVLLLGPLPPEDATALLAVAGGWEEDAAVAALAEALEGIPLALELAATHGPLLPPAVVRARLAAMLDRPRGEGPARHRTMTAAIDWSWQRLDDAQRAALSQLAVCGGAISLEAAEAVLGTPDALQLLLALIERSLLRWEGQSLNLFEVIRRFAGERISDEDRAAALRRLGGYAARVGLEARETADISEGDAAVDALISYPALLRAWDAAVAGDDPTLVCWLAFLIGQRRFGRVHPTRIFPDLKLALSREGAEEQVRCWVRYVLARSAALIGDYALAAEQFQAALDFCEGGRHPKMARLTWCSIAQHHQPDRDRLADARRAVEVCADDEERMLPVALSVLGLVLSRQGDNAEAERVLLRAERYFTDAGLPKGALRVLCLRAGIPRSADERQALIERMREYDSDEAMPSLVQTMLGKLLLEQGAFVEAKAHFERSWGLIQRSGDRIDQIAVLQGRGAVALLLGELSEGDSLLAESLRLARVIRSYQAPTSAFRLAIARLLADRPQEALELLEEAHPDEWRAAFRWITRARLGDPAADEERAAITTPSLAAVVSGEADAEATAEVAEQLPMGPLLLAALGS